MSEKKVPKGIEYADGTLEVISNDKALKIILSSVKVIHEGKKIEFYRSTYFMKEDGGWQRTLESASYQTSDEFIDAISKSGEFSQAVSDIRQQEKPFVETWK